LEAAVSGKRVTCRQFVELVTDYLEGALAEPTVSRVEEHLALCGWCMTYVDQMNDTLAALRRLPPEPVPDELHRAIAAALGATGARNGHGDHLLTSPRCLGPDAGS
jgi:predicted anti-sigma-YlaC factor YlaD